MKSWRTNPIGVIAYTSVSKNKTKEISFEGRIYVFKIIVS